MDSFLTAFFLQAGYNTTPGSAGAETPALSEDNPSQPATLR